jgi:hypothetical protein
MNARALKSRIRSRLQQRKFELERLERAYRHNNSGASLCSRWISFLRNLVERKLRSHVESHLKRREPGILQLLTSYNQLCKEILSLIRHNQAPRGAVAPQVIQRDGIFKLDVDDGIWQDIGLGYDGEEEVPLWLGDEDVRSGIKFLLQMDRCHEEETRLRKERCAMREWMKEEWDSVKMARWQTSKSSFELSYPDSKKTDNIR